MAKKKAAAPKRSAKKRTAKKKPAKKKAKAKPKPKAKAKGTQRGKCRQAARQNELTALRNDSIVTDLYRQGYGATDIALLLDKDPANIRKVIARTRERWRADSLEQYQEQVDRCVAVNEYIMQLAFRGYQISQQEEEETDTHTVTEHTEGFSDRKTSQRRRIPKGDPRFLSLAEKANTNIAAILGIQAKDGRDAAESDAKSALIEVIIDDRRQLEALQSMSYKEIEALAVTSKS